jgi:hypothetical protein
MLGGVPPRRAADPTATEGEGIAPAELRVIHTLHTVGTSEFLKARNSLATILPAELHLVGTWFVS